MLTISSLVQIPQREIVLTAIRAQGAGGQNINKVSNAIQLRFDIRASSLPEIYKKRLLALQDQRINKDGVFVIKAQETRSLEQNKQQALARLEALIRRVMVTRKKRLRTRPTQGSQKRRLDSKNKHGRKKDLRRKISTD